MNSTVVYVGGKEVAIGVAGIPKVIELANSGTAFTVASSFNLSVVKMLQDFFMKFRGSLAGTKWVGMVDADSKDFHILNTIGILRIAKERGAIAEFALLTDEHTSIVRADHVKLMDRYGIPIVDSVSSAVNVSVGLPALAPWFEWEISEPHKTHGVTFCSCPSFVSPTLYPMLYECMFVFRPDAVIDAHAYKYGVTAMMAPLCKAYGARMISMNRPSSMYEGREAAFSIIARMPWADVIERVDWDSFQGDEQLELSPWPSRPLIFYNAHNADRFKTFLRSVEDNCDEAMLVINAPGSMEKSSELMKSNERYAEVSIHYDPQYSHWCEGGVFVLKAKGGSAAR